VQHLVLTAGKRNKYLDELTALVMSTYDSGSNVPVYHWYEHENFDEFVESLYSHYCLKGIDTPARQLVILRSQLRGSARATYDATFAADSAVMTFDGRVRLLREQFVPIETIQQLRFDFGNLSQAPYESPKDFAGHLREAAMLAGLNHEPLLEIMYLCGLLPELQIHLKRNGIMEMAAMVASAQSYWKADYATIHHSPDNPFVARPPANWQQPQPTSQRCNVQPPVYDAPHNVMSRPELTQEHRPPPPSRNNRATIDDLTEQIRALTLNVTEMQQRAGETCDDRSCYNCGQPGHLSCNCDKPQKVHPTVNEPRFSKN
jgi:hypothetical protein